MTKKKFSWIVKLNIIFVISVVIYYNPLQAFYCGNFGSKPMLALGLSPTWFDRTFQINRGYKSIISSAYRNEPFFDVAVKGSERFNTITAYHKEENNTGLVFRALNWEGAEETFILQEYTPTGDERYIYEVTTLEGSVAKNGWKKVDLVSCRKGQYLVIPLLGFVLLVLVNIIVVFILKGANALFKK